MEAEKSFVEQKAEQLRAERAASEPMESTEGTLSESPPEDDSADVVDRDNADPVEALSDDEVAPEGDTPVVEASEQDEEEHSPEYSELKDKYDSLEAEFTRRNANRKEVEASLDVAQSQSVEMRHQWEDQIGEAKRQVEFFTGQATQQLQQLQNVNPAMLTPEQQGQYYQALNQATQQHQQMSAQLESLRTQEQSAREAIKKREAEIALARIKTRIPDWGQEKYTAFGELAAEFGYSQQEFFDTTDHRMMLLLNEVSKARDAGEAVKQTIQQRKPNPPKSRAARSSPRNEKGQFTKAKQTFYDNPGKKGTFAEMKALELARERRGR